MSISINNCANNSYNCLVDSWVIISFLFQSKVRSSEEKKKKKVSQQCGLLQEVKNRKKFWGENQFLFILKHR